MRADDRGHPEFPEIRVRKTATGRVAYVAGTRFAVCWIVAMIPRKMSIESFRREYGIAARSIRSALAYAQAFPMQSEADKKRAAANRKWIETMDRHCSDR